MKKQHKLSVPSAVILILTFNLFGKALGLLREIVFANNFGLSSNYDIYLITSIIPLTISTILFYIVQNYFIPKYNSIKVQNSKNLNSFLVNVIIIFVAISSFISIILIFFSDSLLTLYLGKNINDFDLIKKIFLIFIFTIPVNVLFSIFSSYLQAEFEFKSPAIAQIFQNLFIIICVIFLSVKIGIYSIAIGYMAGTLAQLIYLYLVIKKKFEIKISGLGNINNLFSGLTLSLVYIIIIESSSQLYLLADRYFYDRVDDRGIAALNYSTNLYSLPIAVITVTLATAIFPGISELFSSNKVEEIYNKIIRFININVLLFIPIIFIFYFWGFSIIHIIFQRGKFSYSDTLMTTSTLKFYVLGLLPFSIYAGFNKLFYSFGWIKKLLLVSMFAIIVKLFFNYVLVDTLKQNGLALATSLSYTALFLSAGIILLIGEKGLKTIDSLKPFINYLLCAILQYFIAMILGDILLNSNQLYNTMVEITIFLILYFFTLNKIADVELEQIKAYGLNLILEYRNKISKSRF